MNKIKLGVNIDHVATLRNARGGSYPDPVEAAILSIESGADFITAHLREDRRHIKDDDLYNLKRKISAPINLEIAATAEMITIAQSLLPESVCIVPEQRHELTTEGGLDAHRLQDQLAPYIARLKQSKILVTIFIEPEPQQIQAAKKLDVDTIEFHTGLYCNTLSNTELERIKAAVACATSYNLACHAGHGLNYATAQTIAAIPNIVALNIGHFLISDAIFKGLDRSIKQMLQLLNKK